MRLKPPIHIYDRKELGVLLFLGAIVFVFAFTLGIHLGRRAGVHSGGADVSAQAPGVAIEMEQSPSHQELNQQAKTAHQVADQALDQTLHDEVVKTGMRLNQPRQLELPEKTKAQSQVPDVPQQFQGKFALQVGSYPTEAEAKQRMEVLGKTELKPFLRAVELEGKGTWYRVYVGGFSSKLTAEAEGTELQSQHKIDSFIVSNLPE